MVSRRSSSPGLLSCPSVVVVVVVAVEVSGRGEGDLAALWDVREVPLLPLLLLVPSWDFVWPHDEATEGLTAVVAMKEALRLPVAACRTALETMSPAD